MAAAALVATGRASCVHGGSEVCSCPTKCPTPFLITFFWKVSYAQLENTKLLDDLGEASILHCLQHSLKNHAALTPT